MPGSASTDSLSRANSYSAARSTRSAQSQRSTTSSSASSASASLTNRSGGRPVVNSAGGEDDYHKQFRRRLEHNNQVLEKRVELLKAELAQKEMELAQRQIQVSVLEQQLKSHSSSSTRSSPLSSSSSPLAPTMRVSLVVPSVSTSVQTDLTEAELSNELDQGVRAVTAVETLHKALEAAEALRKEQLSRLEVEAEEVRAAIADLAGSVGVTAVPGTLRTQIESIKAHVVSQMRQSEVANLVAAAALTPMGGRSPSQAPPVQAAAAAATVMSRPQGAPQQQGPGAAASGASVCSVSGNDLKVALEEAKEALSCPICLDLMFGDPVVFPSCGHCSCRRCLMSLHSTVCPSCRVPLPTPRSVLKSCPVILSACEKLVDLEITLAKHLGERPPDKREYKRACMRPADYVPDARPSAF